MLDTDNVNNNTFTQAEKIAKKLTGVTPKPTQSELTTLILNKAMRIVE